MLGSTHGFSLGSLGSPWRCFRRESVDHIGGLDQVDKAARMNLGNAGGARIYTMLKTQLRGMRS